MKKYEEGNVIQTLDELFSYNSVWVTVWGRASPTAFLQGWQYRLVKRWLEMGRFKTLKQKGEMNARIDVDATDSKDHK